MLWWCLCISTCVCVCLSDLVWCFRMVMLWWCSRVRSRAYIYALGAMVWGLVFQDGGGVS